MNFASVNNGWHQRGKNQAKIVFKRKTFFMGTFELLYMGVSWSGFILNLLAWLAYHMQFYCQLS